MDEKRWKDEPDLVGLRAAYDLISTDPQKSVINLSDLAERGSKMSMLYLGSMYLGNRAVADPLKAEYWFMRAAEAGSGEACYQLGCLYMEKGDDPKAVQWFGRGSDRGYAPAIFRLGMSYFEGRGVEEDLYKARDLLRLAASAGHLRAKRNLISLLMSGRLGLRARVSGLLLWPSLLMEISFIAFRSSKTPIHVLKERMG